MTPTETFRCDLGERLSWVVERFKTKAQAASAAGVTVEQLNKWMAGTVRVPVEALWRLAQVAEVDYRWLCAGSSDTGLAVQPGQGRTLRTEVMQDVLRAMVSVTASGDVIVANPERFAELALALHDYVIEQKAKSAPVDLDAMSNVIRLASR
jgi:transcriptional regulator with XRE-family HTH domain